MSKYKDWNELMPVLEKILNDRSSSALLAGKGYYGSEMNNCFSMLDDERNPFQSDNKQNLFTAVLEAVEEYENHNQTINVKESSDSPMSIICPNCGNMEDVVFVPELNPTAKCCNCDFVFDVKKY